MATLPPGTWGRVTHRKCGRRDQDFGTITPTMSASRTSSATDPARIFSMTRARCTLTVCSPTPSVEAICLFSIPVTTRANTSVSRGVSVLTRSRISAARASVAARAAPSLGGVGLYHEPRRAGRRRLEERAAIVRHDAAEQRERAPEPGLGVERRVEGLRDVVERAGDRSGGAREVWGERHHRPRVFFAGERRATRRPPAPSG